MLRAAVSFTVTPTNIDSASVGTVTLQITGVSAGANVLIQKFVDYNGNGAVDAGEPMIQSFQVTDNHAFVFNGVTNTAVPGDSNPTSGAITVVLNAINNGIVGGTSGKFVFKLSSPGGVFSPLYKAFTVTATTNSGYGTITGTVTYNGSAIANPAVVVFTPSTINGNTSAGGTFANSSGSYTVKVVPGSYVVGALKSNYVSNVGSSAHIVTVTAGATVTNNLTVVAATETISGKFYDTNTSVGLAGFLMPAQTTNGNLAVGFTDVNGNFKIPVISGQWKISSNERTLGMLGYLRPQNSTKVNATNGSVSGVNIAVTKATAMIYGRFVDNLGNPVPNVDLYADDGQSQYESEAITDGNGYYFAGANSSASANWNVGLNTPLDPALQYYDFTDSYNGANLISGEALSEDFGAVAAPYKITGSVLNASNAPIVGVQVYASATINGTNYQAVNGTTDASGQYVLYVAGNSTWYVNVDCQNNNNNLNNQGYNCVDTEIVSIVNNNGIANFVAPAFGVQELDGSLTDNNGNPISGITVYAVSEDSYPSQSTTTDANGFYEFVVGNGTWDVSVDCTNLAALNYDCPGEQDGNLVAAANVSGVDFFAQSSIPPFFTGEVSLGNGGWYWLGPQGSDTYGFGYFNTANFPYILHLDMGWEYFLDAGDAGSGGYFYDFTDGVWFYTTPGLFPYIYDFNLNVWLFYSPQTNATDRYTSGPRWFLNTSTQNWINDL
ncbi:MAG TPA: carboxypeptidase regulatory-like domain-containing protein [Verrucomicrobiae bacterium]|nr:carboxypeptidase regulatory-like domain-containing protein [Verrucomicrobiae bacterium]